MNKSMGPQQLALDLLRRSTCHVKVAAVIVDNRGRIFSWGWNSMGGDGFGEHAEAAAIRRGNKDRMFGGMIYIAAERGRNGRIVTAKPCEFCSRIIEGWGLFVCYRGKDGIWRFN